MISGLTEANGKGPPKWVILTLGVIVLVASVQAGDPFDSPTGPERVDLSAPPAEVAADSLRVLHAVNHTELVTIVYMAAENETGDSASNSSGPRIGGYQQFRYEPRKHRFLATEEYQDSLPADPDVEVFGRKNVGWVQWRPGHWNQRARIRYTSLEPFEPSAIDSDDVRVRSENASTLVLEVTDRTAGNAAVAGTRAWEAGQKGRLILYVDKETRRLDGAVFVTRDVVGPGTKFVFEMSDYGETRAAPPEGIPEFSFIKVVRDLANGPLFEGRKITPPF